MKLCGNCGEPFESKKHNMIYCSAECCRIVTNGNIVKKYHEKKNKKLTNRTCQSCNTVLSRYNPEDNCYICIAKTEAEANKNLLMEFR